MGSAAPGVRERVLEFLAEYGERGYAVLRAAVDAATSARGRRGVRLGDFSHREVVTRLKAWGIDYNPSMLLRVLERDYGVIETSYRSSNQHWWRFLDLDAVVEALDAYDQGIDATEPPIEGDEEELLDPETELLRVQIASLDPAGMLEELRRLAAKPRLARTELARLRSLAFNELELAARLLRRAEELGYDGPEVEMLREAIKLAGRLSRRLLSAARLTAESRRTVMELARTGSGLLEP
ncbi:hypothetical protein Pyrde_1845 [Pyrodictium delaneyi]|nr:hypothetical protein [Pyrodictium delaneyi]ALL01888.1 hypothetical protein Pyrde_1845 [Pyrodictium delaneyi]